MGKPPTLECRTDLAHTGRIEPNIFYWLGKYNIIIYYVSTNVCRNIFVLDTCPVAIIVAKCTDCKMI